MTGQSLKTTRPCAGHRRGRFTNGLLPVSPLQDSQGLQGHVAVTPGCVQGSLVKRSGGPGQVVSCKSHQPPGIGLRVSHLAQQAVDLADSIETGLGKFQGHPCGAAGHLCDPSAEQVDQVGIGGEHDVGSTIETIQPQRDASGHPTRRHAPQPRCRQLPRRGRLSTAGHHQRHIGDGHLSGDELVAVTNPRCHQQPPVPGTEQHRLDPAIGTRAVQIGRTGRIGRHHPPASPKTVGRGRLATAGRRRPDRGVIGVHTEPDGYRQSAHPVGCRQKRGQQIEFEIDQAEHQQAFGRCGPIAVQRAAGPESQSPVTGGQCRPDLQLDLLGFDGQ